MERRVPPPWESRVRRLLRGEITLEEAIKLPPAERTEGYDPDVFRADMVLLSNLNEIYRATRSWKLIEFGINILGGENRILYMGKNVDWAEYAALCETEGRLLSVGEMFTLLEEGMIDMEEVMEPAESVELEVMEEDPYAVMTIEEAERTLPNKSLVLGKNRGYRYLDLCASLGKALSPQEYAEFVASRTGLEVRRECILQLSLQLRTVDEVLMSMEKKRTPENREALVREMLEKCSGVMFVKDNRLYPRSYIMSHPEEFPLELLARSTTLVKCSGDCLACTNFKHTLSMPSAKLTRI